MERLGELLLGALGAVAGILFLAALLGLWTFSLIVFGDDMYLVATLGLIGLIAWWVWPE